MIAFLRSQGKSSLPHRHSTLEVQREILLPPLSAYTIGWMQQDSQENFLVQSQEHISAIPICELDDPPDFSKDMLPSL